MHKLFIAAAALAVTASSAFAGLSSSSSVENDDVAGGYSFDSNLDTTWWDTFIIRSTPGSFTFEATKEWDGSAIPAITFQYSREITKLGLNVYPEARFHLSVFYPELPKNALLISYPAFAGGTYSIDGSPDISFGAPGIGLRGSVGLFEGRTPHLAHDVAIAFTPPAGLGFALLPSTDPTCQSFACMTPYTFKPRMQLSFTVAIPEANGVAMGIAGASLTLLCVLRRRRAIKPA